MEQYFFIHEKRGSPPAPSHQATGGIGIRYIAGGPGVLLQHACRLGHGLACLPLPDEWQGFPHSSHVLGGLCSTFDTGVPANREKQLTPDLIASAKTHFANMRKAAIAVRHDAMNVTLYHTRNFVETDDLSQRLIKPPHTDAAPATSTRFPSGAPTAALEPTRASPVTIGAYVAVKR
ncbi:hypothetical protein HBH98_036270 [Parastagonospora nodorum]|nr:hypothetical protein HBH53_010390 [Parastagonospora nodorum]KAH3986505.1 hypothetical protein HBH52_041590 [Parastagonospora nodorum]KAH3988167.1 hypothetical protein HBH51_007440 [Parastagonospora nodorum]KAH4040117.1 hypothetical protein HBI09_023940 [Parastagonospora nodorum]KAH4056570.1 hypothetical protein HBH49_055160 [Parastagonospora nodorum]